MPKIFGSTDDTVVMNVNGTNFQFSAVRPEQLQSLTYTLAEIICDISGSVANYETELLKMVKSIVEAAVKHPQKENLILRINVFNNGQFEVLGFIEVTKVDVNSITLPACTGSTALFDAVYYAIGALKDYADVLVTQHNITVNGAVYIITDGVDNASSFTPTKIKNLVEQIKKDEHLDSLVTILIGVNDVGCRSYLQKFQTDAGLTQYVSVANATPGSLAKLGGFISQSISSSSKAILQGAGSQPVQPTSLVF